MRKYYEYPQLFCFTYAGGTATFFDEIEKDIPDYDVLKIEYAGHGTKYKDPFYRGFDDPSNNVMGMI